MYYTYIKEKMSLCVHMSLYMLHDECQVFGKYRGIAPLSLGKIYIGDCLSACHHMPEPDTSAPVRTWKGERD